MSNDSAFLIFSGHNERAVTALCRYFARVGVPFFIVAGSEKDKIQNSAYSDRVLFQRKDLNVTIDLFSKAATLSECELIYCPTTEFINNFVLENRNSIENAGVRINLPAAEIYEKITGKRSSLSLFASDPRISIPRELCKTSLEFPCVVKPAINIHGGRALYPEICTDMDQYRHAVAKFGDVESFAQEYVVGESLYYCGHVDQAGDVVGFWQQNLLQQPGGKSIVLAVEDIRSHTSAELAIKEMLLRERYHGPFMTELIRSDDCYNYIETNPRFWGPLQLTLDVYPEVLSAYARSNGFALDSTIERSDRTPAIYVWREGLAGGKLRRHLSEFTTDCVVRFAASDDVFSRREYADFSG